MANRQVRAAKKQVRAEVIAELQRIAGPDGLRASVVVQKARSTKSPLHSEFEWDDKKAGHEFRLVQARRLIRIAVPEFEGKPDPWVHVPPSPEEAKKDGTQEGTYQPMRIVVANVDWFERALSELVTKVNAAKASAEQLREAAAATDNPDAERMAKIALAITALQTAGAAVSALH